MSVEFKVEWLDEYNTIVRIAGSDEEGKIVWETAMQAPNYAKLYYALQEWFGDDKRSESNDLLKVDLR